MSNYDDYLKKATALKRAKDVDGAIAMIDKALSVAKIGERSRPPAFEKKIYYLIGVKRFDEALASADQMIAESEKEAEGFPQLLGTYYSAGYNQRGKVLGAQGKPEEAFLEYVKATWHWQQAMKLQGRDKDEHTPQRAAETLSEHNLDLDIYIDDDVLEDETVKGLQYATADLMAERFRVLIDQVEDEEDM